MISCVVKLGIKLTIIVVYLNYISPYLLVRTTLLYPTYNLTPSLFVTAHRHEAKDTVSSKTRTPPKALSDVAPSEEMMAMMAAMPPRTRESIKEAVKEVTNGHHHHHHESSAAEKRAAAIPAAAAAAAAAVSAIVLEGSGNSMEKTTAASAATATATTKPPLIATPPVVPGEGTLGGLGRLGFGDLIMLRNLR